MTAVRPALIARLYRAIQQNRMSDAVLLLSQVFAYFGSSRYARDGMFLSELRKLGQEFVQHGDLQNAEEHFKLALALYEAFFVEHHMEAIACARQLLDVLVAQNKTAEIERSLECTFSIIQRLKHEVTGEYTHPVEVINWQRLLSTQSEDDIAVGQNATSSAKKSHIQVLLVEDNPLDAELVEEQLAKASKPVVIERASRLAEAIKIASGGDIDVVLLDLGLPDSRELDTFYRMSASVPSVPVIVLTGIDDRVAAIKAIKKGAYDYLIKGRDDGHEVLRSVLGAVEPPKHRRRVDSDPAIAVHVSYMNAPLAFMYCDLQDQIQNVNDAWCQFWKHESQWFIGKSLKDVLPFISDELLDEARQGGYFVFEHMGMNAERVRYGVWGIRSPENGVVGLMVNVTSLV